MTAKKKIKIEILPPGIAEGSIPSMKEKYFSTWQLECLGEGKGKDKFRNIETYLESLEDLEDSEKED